VMGRVLTTTRQLRRSPNEGCSAVRFVWIGYQRARATPSIEKIVRANLSNSFTI
jgi:hypothetical protein